MTYLEGFTQRSLLCVENDPETRALLAEMLSEYRIVFARNAFEALKEVNAGAFDAYLLDYWLPDWSGPQLCREIRKLDPHAPIVFCTAAARDEDRARGLNAGANAYLAKPVDPKELRSKVRAFVTLADLESLHAKIAEERAIQDELERRAAHLRERAAAAQRLSAAAFERIARVKAYKAFLEGRGTRAHFDRWWPQVFQSAQANAEVS
jgi:DNA-binding response OmpR family regulator